MATILKETVNIEGITVASAIWRKWRKQPVGFLERVLELNPGLSAAKEIPVGTEISFPVDEVASASQNAVIIRLMD
jgi:phage tail protein X